MRDYLSIGSAPCDEECAQVGSPDYSTQARIECRAYMEQLRRLYPEPQGGYFKLKSFPHDFGSYYEVVAVYDDEDEEATEWALGAEYGAEKWDAEARFYLTSEKLAAAERARTERLAEIEGAN